jgi:NhaA family Na+:H+ antiporter
LVALFGARLPSSLRTFILTLAVVDDVIAALIIATVFSGELVPSYLALAGGITAVLALLSWRGITGWWWYLALGLGLWWACHEGGIHPTLAGVATGLAIPSGRTAKSAEHGLRLVVHLVVLPLFVMVNAFIPIGGDNLSQAVTSGMAYAIIVGLVIGKPLGVIGGAALALKSGLAQRDEELTWRIIFGAGLVAGVGFTMSIFMAELAFSGRDEVRVAKLAILAASVFAGAIACTVFGWVARGGDAGDNSSDNKQ